MTPAVLAAIRPHLTLFGPPEPNPPTADPVVKAALSKIQLGAQAPVSGNQGAENSLMVRIIASALGPSNARAQRSAIVNAGATLPGGYIVLAWGGSLD